MPARTYPKTPLSPKVVAASIAGFAAPVVLSVVLALLDYLTSAAGHSWLAAALINTPPIVTVLICAFISALSAGIAGFLKADPLRYKQAVTLAETKKDALLNLWNPPVRPGRR